MSQKTRWEMCVDAMLTIAKIASFLSLVMTVVIKTRMLLGLTNNLEQKKKDFIEKRKKESESKKVNQVTEGDEDED